MVILDYFLWTGEFYHDVKHWQNQYHSYISGIRASYLNRPLPSIDLDLWIENYFIKVQTIQYLHDLRHYQILNVYSRDLNISLVSCKTFCFFFSWQVRNTTASDFCIDFYFTKSSLKEKHSRKASLFISFLILVFCFEVYSTVRLANDGLAFSGLGADSTKLQE